VKKKEKKAIVYFSKKRNKTVKHLALKNFEEIMDNLPTVLANMVIGYIDIGPELLETAQKYLNRPVKNKRTKYDSRLVNTITCRMATNYYSAASINCTLLHYAVNHCTPDQVKNLIEQRKKSEEKKALVNAIDEKRWTPLHHVARNEAGNECAGEIAQTLLTYKANPQVSASGRTPYMLACYYNNVEVAKLLDGGAV